MPERIPYPKFSPTAFSIGKVLYHTPEGAPEDVRVVMKDVCEKYGWEWSTEQAQAYDAYVNAFVKKYIAARKRRTPAQSAEEQYELRAAFGKDCTVVNIITGEKTLT